MKNRSWFDFAEYASLVGLGVGTVAASVSSQLLYTSAPLSLVLVLNLINRRRLIQLGEQNRAIAVHELDQKLSKNMELLNQQVADLPTPETLGSVKKSLLIKNREVFERLSQDISTVQKELQERLDPIEQQNLGNVRRDLGTLQDQYRNVNDLITQLNARIQELSTSDRVEDLDRLIARLRADTDQLRNSLQNLSDQTRPTLTSLQEQVNHLNRQFQKLPPPFDSTALKQEVAELIRVVADLVPKRDWSNLVTEMQALHQQQESHSQNEESLRRKLQELSQQLQSRPAKSSLTSLQNQINHLNRQFQKLPPPFDPSSLKQEVAELIRVVADRVPKHDWNALVIQLKALQKQQVFQSQVEETLRRELREINRQVQAFVAQTEVAQAPTNAAAAKAEEPIILQPQRQFQARIEETLQRELEAIGQQLQSLPSGPQLQRQIEDTLRRELQEINQQLRSFPSDPHYELVFDFKSSLTEEASTSSASASAHGSAHSSRAVLEEALAVTQERLILIWPWSSQCVLDEALFEQIDGFLAQGRQLDLGWCHQAEREHRFIQSINQRWAIQPRQKELQATLQRLLRLKQTYPEQFQFQILGTSENFLVSDHRFAVLGTDDSLIQQSLFPELELKLRTTDREVIQQLIHRFDHPVLHADDVAAYWNRAVTRYDLGDKQGALADFNQVLGATAEDAIAYNYRGLVQFDLGDYQSAMSDFSHAVDLDPHFITAYCNRGFVASEMGDQLGAIADLSLAIQYQPDSAIAFFYRGLAGQKIGDFQGALTDYNAAIELVPDAPQCYYYRGITLQKLQNFEAAIADFETAADLFMQRGNKANADKAVKNLSRLQQGLEVGTLHSVASAAIADAPAADAGETASAPALPVTEILAAEAKTTEAPVTEAIAPSPVESQLHPQHLTREAVAADPHESNNGVDSHHGTESNNGIALDTLESFFQAIGQVAESEQNGATAHGTEPLSEEQSAIVDLFNPSSLFEEADDESVEPSEFEEYPDALTLNSLEENAIADQPINQSASPEPTDAPTPLSGTETQPNNFHSSAKSHAERGSASGTETISSFFYDSTGYDPESESDLAETGWSGDGTLIDLFETIDAEPISNGHPEPAIAETLVDAISASALDAAAQRLHQKALDDAIAASLAPDPQAGDSQPTDEKNALINFFEHLSADVEDQNSVSSFPEADNTDTEEPSQPHFTGVGSEYAESMPLTVSELGQWF